jgi:hypothetical protein
MNRLFRSNSSVSSRSSIPMIPEIVNEEHAEYHDDDSLIDFNYWNIPKVPSKEIYRKKWLKTSFRTEHHVKTVEKVYTVISQIFFIRHKILILFIIIQNLLSKLLNQ